MHKIFEKGRSMIEMLGVLAIIGVLSVGGIAGYSKAMEKFKLNQAVKDYTYVTQNILEQSDNLTKSTTSSLTEICLSMNIIPPTWTLSRVTNIGKVFADNLGNSVDIFKDNTNNLYMEIYLDGIKNKSALYNHTCTMLLNDFVIPMHAALKELLFWNSVIGYSYYTGDGYFSEEYKPIKDLTLTEIQELCKNCEKRCSIVLTFKN